MNINLHNKIEITTSGKTYTFFNKVLPSIKQRLKNLQSYFDYVAIGLGTNNGVDQNFKLEDYADTILLTTEFLQDNPEFPVLFCKKNAIISNSALDGKFIKEAGICSDDGENPTVYNYFSLTSDELPNGILKEAGKEIVISIYIYLELSASTEGFLTLGENKFVDFLLGQGTSGEIFACPGKNISENTAMRREQFNSDKIFPAKLTVSEGENLSLSFSADLGFGEVYEIVFFMGNEIFARMNTLEFYMPTTSTIQILPRPANIIDLGKNVKSVFEITNLSTNERETDFNTANYATSFGDKISLPFNNLFDNQTPRFVSKDSSKIFFVSDDKVFGFENKNFRVLELNFENNSFKNITKVIAFDDFLFVISKSAPFIFAFVYKEDCYRNISIVTDGFDKPELLQNINDIDITLAKNGNFMFGILEVETKLSYCLYFTLNEQKDTLTFSSYLTNLRPYDLVMAMYKNSFSDAMLLFIQVGEEAFYTRLIYYYPDKTSNSNYTSIAWQFIENMKELYIKNRAVVVEKTTSPSLWFYLYPQLYKYSIEINPNEKNDFVSTNLLYLIQKISNSSYKIYSLVGYNTPSEFEDGIPKEINQEKILDFEFLNDTLLFFMNDSKNPIIAYNFFSDSTLVENVSSSENSYEVKLEKYNLLGSKNEGVTATFTVKINL